MRVGIKAALYIFAMCLGCHETDRGAHQIIGERESFFFLSSVVVLQRYLKFQLIIHQSQKRHYSCCLKHICMCCWSPLGQNLQIVLFTLYKVSSILLIICVGVC